jgi:hypothetical protein
MFRNLRLLGRAVAAAFVPVGWSGTGTVDPDQICHGQCLGHSIDSHRYAVLSAR